MVSLRSFLTGSILAIGALAASLEKRAINLGPVEGDTFIHDPTVVKKPDGTYLAAFTANGVGLKTYTDRTTWKDVGAAFPNGAAWRTTYTKGDKNLRAPDLSYHKRPILHVLLGPQLRYISLRHLPCHE
jgi:arabinan endo-1,5-alpha-L-arabinosidase